MNVELLYFDGCPSWQAALENLRTALGDDQHIRLLKVETMEQAKAERFLGSPTIRVDGRDLFPVDDGLVALACRVYETPEGHSGVPTVQLLRLALST